jgi:anti-anti-sigma regulatory factor
MNSNTARLLVWTGKEAACVRVTGRATFAVSVEFRKLLRRLWESGLHRILLDLSECLGMDSTFLGVLAHEVSHPSGTAVAATAPVFELLNTPKSVRETIEDLGVAPLFQFVECDPGQHTFEPVASTSPASRTELTRTSLEAHEALMALHPTNVARFKDVARFLAGELESADEPGATPPEKAE